MAWPLGCPDVTHPSDGSDWAASAAASAVTGLAHPVLRARSTVPATEEHWTNLYCTGEWFTLMRNLVPWNDVPFAIGSHPSWWIEKRKRNKEAAAPNAVEHKFSTLFQFLAQALVWKQVPNVNKELYRIKKWLCVLTMHPILIWKGRWNFESKSDFFWSTIFLIKSNVCFRYSKK